MQFKKVQIPITEAEFLAGKRFIIQSTEYKVGLWMNENDKGIYSLHEYAIIGSAHWNLVGMYFRDLRTVYATLLGQRIDIELEFKPE